MLRAGRYLITGAASGIGRACAQVLAEAGGTPVLVDRNEDGVRETSAEYGGEWHVADVCSSPDVARLTAALAAVMVPLPGSSTPRGSSNSGRSPT